jgi:hypothetical protein
LLLLTPVSWPPDWPPGWLLLARGVTIPVGAPGKASPGSLIRPPGSLSGPPGSLNRPSGSLSWLTGPPDRTCAPGAGTPCRIEAAAG